MGLLEVCFLVLLGPLLYAGPPHGLSQVRWDRGRCINSPAPREFSTWVTVENSPFGLLRILHFTCSRRILHLSYSGELSFCFLRILHFTCSRRILHLTCSKRIYSGELSFCFLRILHFTCSKKILQLLQENSSPHLLQDNSPPELQSRILLLLPKNSLPHLLQENSPPAPREFSTCSRGISHLICSKRILHLS